MRRCPRTIFSKRKGSKYTLPEIYRNKLNDFYAYSVNKADTVKYIKECYENKNYLIDPHTAVAYGAYENLKDKLSGKTVVVSTASPFKFIETVDEIFNTNKEGFERINEIANITSTLVPEILYNIYNSKYDKVVWKKENMEENLRKLIGEIDENC